MDSTLDIGPYMSGRYLVKSIRHQVNTNVDKHRMVVDCIKDSVMRASIIRNNRYIYK